MEEGAPWRAGGAGVPEQSGPDRVEGVSVSEQRETSMSEQREMAMSEQREMSMSEQSGTAMASHSLHLSGEEAPQQPQHPAVTRSERVSFRLDPKLFSTPRTTDL